MRKGLILGLILIILATIVGAADVKISDLPDGASTIASADIIPVVHTGTTKRVTLGQVLGLGGITTGSDGTYGLIMNVNTTVWTGTGSGYSFIGTKPVVKIANTNYGLLHGTLAYGFFATLTGPTAVTLPTSGTLQTTTGTPASFVIASQAAGDLLVASSASAWARQAKGANNTVLAVNNSGVLDYYANHQHLDDAAQFASSTASKGTRLLNQASINNGILVTDTVVATGNAVLTTTSLAAGTYTRPFLEVAGTWSGQQTFVAPILGAATATSLNGHTFTTGSSTFTGTAGQTYTFPTTSQYLAPNPLTTIGDLPYANSTATPAAYGRIAAVAAGSFLRSAGTGTVPAYSTSTFADTYVQGGILHAATANTIAALAPGAIGSFLMSNGASAALSYLAPGAANYILVGAGTTTIPVWTAPTGTGAPVLANTPTLITPVIGAATGTSLAVTGIVDGKATLATCGASCSVTALTSYVVCTQNCAITPPAPAAGVQVCARNSNNGSFTITFAALGATKYYEKPDHTGLGTATTGTLAATAAVTNSICIIGYDANTYYVWGTPVGTWTAN